jgi:ElaB/YqjD/DUF883 family membrane-anchored ribosome-binding protein
MGETTNPHAVNEGETAQDVDEIRDDIEETRERLSSTIDQIQERLNPEKIKANVADSIREATIGKAQEIAQNVGDKAHELQEKAHAVAAPLLENVQEKLSHNGHANSEKPVAGPLKPISEQVVVVFGASSGIGRETALQFAKRGAKVVVAARGQCHWTRQKPRLLAR